MLLAVRLPTAYILDFCQPKTNLPAAGCKLDTPVSRHVPIGNGNRLLQLYKRNCHLNQQPCNDNNRVTTHTPPGNKPETTGGTQTYPLQVVREKHQLCIIPQKKDKRASMISYAHQYVAPYTVRTLPSLHTNTELHNTRDSSLGRLCVLARAFHSAATNKRVPVLRRVFGVGKKNKFDRAFRKTCRFVSAHNLFLRHGSR